MARVNTDGATHSVKSLDGLLSFDQSARDLAILKLVSFETGDGRLKRE